MPKPALAWKDWLVPPVPFPLLLTAMIVVCALLRTAP